MLVDPYFDDSYISIAYIMSLHIPVNSVSITNFFFLRDKLFSKKGTKGKICHKVAYKKRNE